MAALNGQHDGGKFDASCDKCFVGADLGAEGHKMADTLYSRLGGYDAIAAVVDDLLPRLRRDSRLKRFWSSPRPKASDDRERQMAVDFIAASAGGPTIYLGRDMKLAHAGMGIDAEDYAAFKRHLADVLEKFKVAAQERDEVMAFVSSLAADIIEK